MALDDVIAAEMAKTAKESQNSGANKGEMSVNLKALLMVGPDKTGTAAGDSGQPRKKPVISYDFNALMEIGKNQASRKRPEHLDSEYDFINKNDTHPRWDPERWHAGTKAQHMKNRKDSLQKDQNGKDFGKELGKGGTDGSWRKKDKRGTAMDDEIESRHDDGESQFRLGPKRSSYKEGCKPGVPQERENSGFKKDGWRENRKNDRGWRRNEGDDDKFRDFRGKDDDGRRSRFNRHEYDRDGRNSRHDRNRGGFYDRNQHEEAEPEWMTGGAETQFDFMELGGFDDDNRGQKSGDPQRPPNPESPVLEAFDPSTFGMPSETGGGLEDGLETGLGKGDTGNEDNLDADMNGLLGSITKGFLDDDDEEVFPKDEEGSSRFSKFFEESTKPDSPQKQQQPSQGIQRLDPAVWNASDQINNVQRQLRGMPVPPRQMAPINKMLAGQVPMPTHPFPGLPPGGPGMPPGQPMSLEELEGRGNSPPGGPQEQPPANLEMKFQELQMKLAGGNLNLSKQRSEFEQKNRQRMMMLQQQGAPGPQKGPKIGNIPGNPLLAGPGGPFGQFTGPGGPRQPFLDSRSLEQQPPVIPVQTRKPENPQANQRKEIFNYLTSERKNRKLTPTEANFIEQYTREVEIQSMIMDQNLNFGRGGPSGEEGRRPGMGFPGQLSLDRQKQQFDEKFRQQQNGQPDGAPQKPNSFNQFTPTSVMRKMVRTREDGSSDRPQRSQKITPLEYTGVTRVPKSSSQDMARKLPGNGLGPKPGMGMRSIPGAPQVMFQPMRGPNGAPMPANLVPNQALLQQMVLQNRFQGRGPPQGPPGVDPFLHQRKQPQASRPNHPIEKSDENIIHKLLTPNRPGQFPDFG